jgi:hypothetical protein
VFVTVVHIRPSLFVAKVRSLPEEWSPKRGFTRVGSSLACQYYTGLVVSEGGKHSNLTEHGINYSCKKKFYCAGTNIIKNISSVIYECS